MRGFAGQKPGPKDNGMASLFAPDTVAQNDRALDDPRVPVSVTLTLYVNPGDDVARIAEDAIAYAQDHIEKRVPTLAVVERDRTRAEAITERAIGASESKADPRWLALVESAIAHRAHTGDRFTSDDVWDDVARGLSVMPDVEPPKDRQAGGNLFRKFARSGVIRDTGQWVRSDRPKAHRKKLTVWSGSKST